MVVEKFAKTTRDKEVPGILTKTSITILNASIFHKFFLCQTVNSVLLNQFGDLLANCGYLFPEVKQEGG